MKFKGITFGFLALFLGIGLCSSSKINSFENEITDNNGVLNFKNDLNDVSEGEEEVSNEALNVRVRNISTTDLATSMQLSISVADDAPYATYFVGYNEEGRHAYLTYDVQKTDNKVETRQYEIIFDDRSYGSYAVGANFAASLSKNCDIELAKGEILLYQNGFRIENVYPGVENETGVGNPIIPIFDDRVSVYCDTSNIDSSRYPIKFDQSQFFSINYEGKANYNGYSAFTFRVEENGTELYPTLSSQTARAYMTNEFDLQNGTSYVKASLSFGGATQFEITFNDGSNVIINSTAKIYEITNGGSLVLFFEGIDSSTVSNIEISGLDYQLVIYNAQINANISRTNFSQRFGKVHTNMVPLYDSNGNTVKEAVTQTFNINTDLIVGLTFGISTILFFGSVVPAYFYLKKKNRNDEFKRMNTKSYWSTATYGYLCIESVLLFIVYVVIRSTVLNNALTVYNPTDTFIFIFGIASIILIGYFIRYFAIMIKNNIEKKRRDRLNINKDVIDDGTLIIRK